MRSFNVFTPEFSLTTTAARRASKAGRMPLSPEIGASRMVATVYELPAGESTWRCR